MLPAANRMRAAADFSETTRRGTKVSRGSVVVYAWAPDAGAVAMPAPVTGPAIVGLIVGKAVGGSVERHRASRRIRGALRPLVPSLPSGTRIVVRALPGADTDPGLATSVAAGITRALDRVRRP